MNGHTGSFSSTIWLMYSKIKQKNKFTKKMKAEKMLMKMIFGSSIELISPIAKIKLTRRLRKNIPLKSILLFMILSILISPDYPLFKIRLRKKWEMKLKTKKRKIFKGRLIEIGNPSNEKRKRGIAAIPMLSVQIEFSENLLMRNPLHFDMLEIHTWHDKNPNNWDWVSSHLEDELWSSKWDTKFEFLQYQKNLLMNMNLKCKFFQIQNEQEYETLPHQRVEQLDHLLSFLRYIQWDHKYVHMLQTQSFQEKYPQCFSFIFAVYIIEIRES